MKIVFMGTPDFSVGALNALLEAGHEIAAVVTQPDKPKGRKMEMQYPPVKEAALNHHLNIYQPERVKKNEEFYRILKEISPDVIVVVAFGQILPKEILTLPRYGCINIHASLLPAYRGAAPIQWAVINGEEKTGVTTMQMDAGLDTGDILETTEITLDQSYRHFQTWNKGRLLRSNRRIPRQIMRECWIRNWAALIFATALRVSNV